jgi:hypothetical protein
VRAWGSGIYSGSSATTGRLPRELAEAERDIEGRAGMPAEFRLAGMLIGLFD